LPIVFRPPTRQHLSSNILKISTSRCRNSFAPRKTPPLRTPHKNLRKPMRTCRKHRHSMSAEGTMLTSPLTTLLFQSRSIHAILNFVHVISNLSGSIRTGLGREPSPSAEESRAILAKRHHRHYRALDSASVFVTFNALSATMSSGASRHHSPVAACQRLHVGQPVMRSLQWSIPTKG
jgi:hypothetical protein